LFDVFPIRNGLKQGNALSPSLFTFSFEHAIRRVWVNQDGLKLNDTQQLLVYKYYSGDKIQNEMGGHVARMGERRGVCSNLFGKPEGKRPLARPRRRLGDNIKMDLQEVGRGAVD
jgi:hypothetical protein